MRTRKPSSSTWIPRSGAPSEGSDCWLLTSAPRTCRSFPSMKGFGSTISNELGGGAAAGRGREVRGRVLRRVRESDRSPRRDRRRRCRDLETDRVHRRLDLRGRELAGVERAVRVGRESDRRRSGRHRGAGPQPRHVVGGADVDAGGVDPVRREHAPDVQEHPQRGRQGQRRLQPVDEDPRRHVPRDGHRPAAGRDPAREGAQRPGQGHLRPVPGRCHVHRAAEGVRSKRSSTPATR
jgi:hypothetical protein